VPNPFVDVVELVVTGGHGGDGCTSFNSEPYNPRGGPDGGNGGPGGDVVVVASDGMSTLAELNDRHEIDAGDGGDGGPKNQHGATGDDVEITVPVGTVVSDQSTGEKLGELTSEDDSLVVAEGGEGGRGNRCFANSQRQAPSFHEYGEGGESRKIQLELKLIADVGLVGRPNAGKSTLLDALTGAHPEVDDYEFTTVSPNLGVMFNDYERMTLCDIPGLIENAHQGAGLGFDFLRHVDRTKILLHVVDLAADNPVQRYRMIMEEIRAYDEAMLEKPMVLALNKTDRVDEDMVQLFLDEVDPDDEYVSISALEGTNLDKLQETLWSTYHDLPDEEDEDQATDDVERVVKMEQENRISVTPVEDRYLLRGAEVRQLVERFDLSNPDALAYVRDRLLDLNLHKILERAGCEPGDTVQVGRQVFEYTG
jgi:GTP-binding protein